MCCLEKCRSLAVLDGATVGVGRRDVPGLNAAERVANSQYRRK
jgi:hypothetical protein